jgi:hypothetical protein
MKRCSNSLRYDTSSYGMYCICLAAQLYNMVRL